MAGRTTVKRILKKPASAQIPKTLANGAWRVTIEEYACSRDDTYKNWENPEVRDETVLSRMCTSKQTFHCFELVLSLVLVLSLIY